MAKKDKNELNEELKKSQTPDNNEANEEEVKKKKSASNNEQNQQINGPTKRQIDSVQNAKPIKEKTTSTDPQQQKPTQQQGPTGAARMRSAPNIRYNVPSGQGGKPISDNELTTRQTTAPKGTKPVRQSGADLEIRSSDGKGRTSGAPRTNRSYYNAGGAPPKPMPKAIPRVRPEGYVQVKPLIRRGVKQTPILNGEGLIVGYEVENIIFDPITGEGKVVTQKTTLDKPIAPTEEQKAAINKPAANKDAAKKDSAKADNATSAADANAADASGSDGADISVDTSDGGEDNWAETHDFEIRHDKKEPTADTNDTNLGNMNTDSPDASPSMDIDLEGEDNEDLGEFDTGEDIIYDPPDDGEWEEFDPNEQFDDERPLNYDEYEMEGDEQELTGDEFEGDEQEMEGESEGQAEGENVVAPPNAPPPPPPTPDFPDFEQFEDEDGYAPPTPPQFDDEYDAFEEGEGPLDEQFGETETIDKKEKRKKERKLDTRTQEEKEAARKRWKKIIIILLLLLVITGFTIFGIFVAPELFEVPIVYYINPTTDQETFIISKELEGMKFMPGHTIMFEEVLKIKNNVVNEEGIKNNMFAFSVNAYIEFNGRKQPENIIDRIIFSSDAAYTRYKDNRALYFYRDVVAPSEEVDVVKGIVLSGPNLKNSEIVGQKVNLIFEVEACYPAEELLYDFTFYESKMMSWIYQIVDIADELKNQGYQ